MTSLDLTKTLDDLCHAEHRSLSPRLCESTVFVSWASAEEADAVRDIVTEEQEHLGWLVAMISDLGESPTPCTADLHTANIHYLELNAMTPRLIQNKKNLITTYEQASVLVSSDSAASELVARIAERHKTHLARLEQRANNLHTTTDQN